MAALLLGRQRHRVGNVRVAHAQLGHELGDLGRVLAERLAQRLRRDLARGRLDLLDKRQVGRRPLLVDAVAGEHAQTEALSLGGHLLHQPGLPDPGLAPDQQQRALPVARALHRLEQPRALPGASDEGGALLPREDPAGLRRRPWHLPEAPGRIDPPERDFAPVHELAARSAEHAVHRVRGEDAAGGRHRLDTLGDDQRLPVEPAVLGQHLAGVQADAELDRAMDAAAVAVSDRALDLLGAGDGATRRLEGHH